MLAAAASSEMPILSTGPSNTVSASPATHTCLVGADGLEFIPSQITANVGDIIEYRFFPQNHSVVRAAFGEDLACAPYEDSGSDLVGFWSGFHPISAVSSNPPIYQVRINDTEPIFFYCSSSGACQEGMVGVINPNSTFTLRKQLSYALNTTISFSPVDRFPSEALKSETTPSPPTTTSAIPASGPIYSNSSMSSGAITGIVIGASVAFLLFVATSLYQRERYKRRNETNKPVVDRRRISQYGFEMRNPTSETPQADGIEHPPWPSNMPGTITNQPEVAYQGIGDNANMYRYLTPDDITAESVAGFTKFPHIDINTPIYTGPRYGVDSTASQPVSTVAAEDFRSNTNHPGSVGPHELPVQPVASETRSQALGLQRQFSFTESDRGWNPRDGDLGVRN